MRFTNKREEEIMALIKCPECGKEISDRAECCPVCGFKQPPMKKRVNKKDMYSLEVSDDQISMTLL